MVIISTWKKRVPIAASLLRTCRFIHAEARGILYSQPILIGGQADPIVWLRGIGQANRFYLRNVHLGSTKGFELPRKDCQSVTRRVAKLLSDAPNLKSLNIRAMRIPNIDWNLHRNLSGQMQQKPWFIAAQHIAKLIYDEFRPVFSVALSRGQTPQQLCTLVKAHRNLFSGRSDQGIVFAADVLALRLNTRDIAGAEAELAGHLKFLLERNLRYRRYPRSK
ncbi:hypothetical protein CGRA01v4_02169 [Colletotrichum graminicola]|uniref:Uncharacterized protein n=1 Tax=Colletotrichum graminicola (strain M1.001 / M2 / FGSC 10212) TaxID=645133 RepID=E3Q401_COLGM|nr:uncharacterized protein GLRG_00897 [Colletotrichum graminicola M1.001]EFQ25753.1 hypothetical protein GLRG_00897 [Colletotrichum graminicola M1.001]WDK10890.1 hypothetical protein CGRA01v4_02169 [Colletotrichum graminicola]